MREKILYLNRTLMAAIPYNPIALIMTNLYVTEEVSIKLDTGWGSEIV